MKLHPQSYKNPPVSGQSFVLSSISMPTPEMLTAANSWLALFSSAIAEGDSAAVSHLFLPDGWFRDILVFSWDFRSLEGRDKIKAYLEEGLSKTAIANIRLDESDGLAPRTFVFSSTRPAGVELSFTFDLPHGSCRGHARLVEDGDGAFRALAVMMSLNELRGHEETSTLPLRDDITGNQGRDMQKEYADWVHHVETKPDVLISMYEIISFI